MKKVFFRLLGLAGCVLMAGCQPGDRQTEGGETESVAEQQEDGHALRGVITGILPERGALVVKHEEIPDVMAAMTMMLRVDEEVLGAAEEGQEITAILFRKEGQWWLRNVRPVVGAGP